MGFPTSRQPSFRRSETVKRYTGEAEPLAWLEPENHNLFKTFQGHLAWADACKYGKNWAKAWCFASNSPRIGRLAALCNHNIQHESIAGVKNSKGEYLSTLTAEYPPLLAQQIIQSVSHRVSRISGECRPLPLQGTSSFRAPLGPQGWREFRLCRSPLEQAGDIASDRSHFVQGFIKSPAISQEITNCIPDFAIGCQKLWSGNRPQVGRLVRLFKAEVGYLLSKSLRLFKWAALHKAKALRKIVWM